MVESDSEFVKIYYGYQKGESCFSGVNAVKVVPAKVIAYKYDDWIIAKSSDLET